MNKFSTRLVNYVEPVIFNGLTKTVFYTEFNTNFEKGDKVFIINGNYDSNSIIQSETYNSQTTGYNVLQVDNCKIILDIDYTGIKPNNDYTNTNTIDEYIKVYHITSQRDFDYINSLTTTTYNSFYSKFEYGLSNNIIYVDSAFSGSTSSITSNLGVPSSGFYQKQISFGTWINLPTFLGTSSIYFKTTGFSPTYSLSNNGKLQIIGEDIIVNNQIFKQREIYGFNQISNKWETDATSIPSYISKLNFRKGIFKGEWNDGIYGSYDSQINWNNGTWNSGVLLNTRFVSGTINSKTNNSVTQNNYANTSLNNPTFITPTTIPFNIVKYNSATPSRTLSYNSPIKQSDSSLTQTYYCKLDKYGLPIQSTDFSNNKNYGFNYIIDSDIESGSIINGNFENCNIGLTNFMPITGYETRPYGTISDALSIFYTDTSFDYKLKIQGGSFKFCDINTVAFQNSYITDCNIKNSNINTSTLASNQIENSVVVGDYSVNPIKIINADLWSYIKSGLNRGVLKLYISDSDLLRLNDFDSIYIDRLNKELYLSSFNDENKVWLNYENKYIFDIFNNSEISSDTIIVSFKNKTDNKYKTYIDSTSTPTTVFVANNNNYASIDIDLGSVISWYQTTVGTTITKYFTDTIITTDTVSNLFTNTNICKSNFESGILINSNWKNGDSINKLGNIIRLDDTNLSISIPLGSTTSIYVDISNQTYNSYDEIKLNDKLWLQGINYINPSGSQSDISGIYQVESIELPVYPNTRRIRLYDFDISMNKANPKLGSLTLGGTFSVGITNPNYVSLHRFKIENSTITEGLFKNTLVVNSNIYNADFDNLDTKLSVSNISKLRFINTLFKGDNNKINSGIAYKSHILNTYWNNGIIFNSILSEQTFSNGVFKNGYWLNGTFNNGIFIDSDDLVISTQSYDNNSGYYRSWKNGSFNSGQFYNSTWIEGTFNNGRLFNSRWYGGIWNNGILGLKNSPYLNTTMGYYPNLGTGSNITIWNNGTVDSAIIGGYSNVYWYTGKFNDGSFFSFGSQSESIWHNGDFNGGRFEGVAKWKNGIFNRGKFLSYYGWTLSNSTASSDYAWENGKFNNGQFGQQSLGTNSTWFNGEFNNGSFYGRVWNSGIFHGGVFNGSYTNSVSKNEINFVNSFTNSYYGLWRNGYFADTISLGRPDQMVYTELRRASESAKKAVVTATIQNALWLNGVFSHANGTTKNIAWLDGSFLKGKFSNSSFNPYVDRTLSGATPSFNFDSSCYWKNGTFDGGNFYISEWKNGTFNSGFMQGAIWRNGTWFYGTADNIYWEKGTWKNGNWFGSNFNNTSLTQSSITNDKTLKILYNIASASNNRNIHLWNAFTGSSVEQLYNPLFSSPGNGWTQSNKNPLLQTISGASNNWSWGNSYLYNDVSLGLTIVSLGNNYNIFYSTAQSKFLYGMSYSGSGLTTSVITEYKPYTLSATIFIDNTVSTLTNNVLIEMWMGGTYSLHSLGMGYNNISKAYTSTDVYLWTNGFTYSTIALNKRNSYPDNVEVVVLNFSAKITEIDYNPLYNNKLYTVYSATPSITATLSVPTSLVTSTDTGLSLQFGNGIFVSGIWENGIWNNGYRNDDTLTLCDLYPVAYYIKVSSSLHRLQLHFLDNTTKPPFKVGDYVSVGNVVAIDVNNNRRIVNDKFRVVSISTTAPYNSIVLEYILNTPILEITKDSSNHLIYVSKNVWLSGGFLNGYFKGIWNYGLFKGYPYITEMENSHWLDGVFDGGHFKSVVSSATNSSTSEEVSYNTGLIQNFNFTDHNVATPFKFLYQSWIDVNYVDESQTNLYQEKNYYDASNGVNTTLSKANLNGFITYDVLSSKSYFRNGYDTNSKRYSLGSKYKKYVNYLENIGDFNNLFSNTPQYSSLGMDNFTNDGWTITSLINGNSGSFSYDGYAYTYTLYPEYFTINNIDSTLNIISSTFANEEGTSTILPFPSTSVQNYIILNNSNTENIPSLRYSMVEYLVLSFTGFSGPTAGNPRANANANDYYPPAVNFMINPATWSLNQRPANHLYTNSDVKREYFYNRHSLLMEFVGGALSLSDVYPLNITLDNLSFYEVDSIPFFQYTTQSNVDSSVQVPLSATAPYINYNSANFNYVGNITLNIDVNTIANQKSVFNLANSGNIFVNTTPLQQEQHFKKSD